MAGYNRNGEDLPVAFSVDHIQDVQYTAQYIQYMEGGSMKIRLENNNMVVLHSIPCPDQLHCSEVNSR